MNLLGLRADCSKWILDAAAGDRSRMRNRVAMDVFTIYARLPYETDNAGRYSSLGRYVEVWANGEYQGLFCLTDRINRELLGGKATTDGQTHCVIYNCKNYGSGNYLNPYEEGPAEGDEEWNSWEMKYPDEPTAAAWQTLLDLFDVAWDDTPDDEYDTTVQRYFYWDNLVDVYLLTMVCGLADMGYKNCYLVCPDITEDSRCVLVPVDMDYTFGCTWNGCYWDENPLHNCVIDLPYIVQGIGSKITDRFTSFNSEEEMYDTNREMIELAYRKLMKGGYLVMKTMDVSYSMKQLWVVIMLFKRHLKQALNSKTNSFLFQTRDCLIVEGNNT